MSDNLSRKSAIISLLSLPLAATAIGTAAAAANKSPQNAVQYQNHPMGNKKCSGCKFYIAGKTAKANGACQIVAGSIRPNGYCVAYAPKG